MEFCDAHPDCGLWYRLDQTTSQFTFANSESASCKQKIVVLLENYLLYFLTQSSLLSLCVLVLSQMCFGVGHALPVYT